MNSIRLQNVSFTYQSGTKAVDDVSIHIDEGERVAIIGQNGAGKTTTVKLMNGLYKPQKGTVFVNDIDTKSLTTAQISRYVGYVFQNPDDQIFNTTVRSEVSYWMRYNDFNEEEINRITVEAAKLCGIENLLDINPYEIPFSMKRFITIASVIVSRPSFIVLDEPTAGQDLPGLRILSSLLQHFSSENVGCITISHDMEFVSENFARVIVMSNHQVLFDSNPHDAFRDAELLKKAHIRKPVVAEIAENINLPHVLTKNELVESLLPKA